MAERPGTPSGMGSGDGIRGDGAPRGKSEADPTPYAIPSFRDIRGEDPEIALLDRDGKWTVRKVSKQGAKKLFRELALYMTKAEL